MRRAGRKPSRSPVAGVVNERGSFALSVPGLTCSAMGVTGTVALLLARRIRSAAMESPAAIAKVAGNTRRSSSSDALGAIPPGAMFGRIRRNSVSRARNDKAELDSKASTRGAKPSCLQHCASMCRKSCSKAWTRVANCPELPPLGMTTRSSFSSALIRAASSQRMSVSRVSTRVWISPRSEPSNPLNFASRSLRNSPSTASMRDTSSARSCEGKSPRAAKAARSRAKAASMKDESTALSCCVPTCDADVMSQPDALDDGVAAPVLLEPVKLRISSVLAASSRSNTACTSATSASIFKPRASHLERISDVFEKN
mmetsp:Transcript_96718/g.273226  ORF Transcript_96718/g.273226 Transcript_96718/m.273226 type:complete len:314 (+) Transcript_96718:1314-2255(+)